MPNWCQNVLVVSGGEREVRLFASKVSGDSPLMFASLVPEPDGLLERADLSFEKCFDLSLPEEELDWSAWRRRFWGSKWEANFDFGGGLIIREGRAYSGLSEATFDFVTAWSPPTEWVKRASEIFPSLDFSLTFAEAGNDFAGRLVSKNGQAREEELSVSKVLSSDSRWY